VIVLVRHGPTEWSVTGRHTGKTDLPLTDDGRETAALLRERLTRYEFATVLVSPLRRARETAELAGLADRAQVEPDLHEWDYGRCEGRTSKEIRETTSYARGMAASSVGALAVTPKTRPPTVVTCPSRTAVAPWKTTTSSASLQCSRPLTTFPVCTASG